MLAFLSLLMAKDVFEEVKLGFFVVSHTCEDINGCFGYLSKKLKEENNYIDENFHDPIRKTVHSSIDSRDSKFLILGPRLFEGWP